MKTNKKAIVLISILSITALWLGVLQTPVLNGIQKMRDANEQANIQRMIDQDNADEAARIEKKRQNEIRLQHEHEQSKRSRGLDIWGNQR